MNLLSSPPEPAGPCSDIRPSSRARARITASCSLRSSSAFGNASVQGASVPVFNPAHFRVKIAFQRVIEVDQRKEVRPRQLSQQRWDNFNIGKCLDKADHVAQRFLGKAPSELGDQFCRQRLQNLRPLFSPLLMKNVPPNAVADLPIKHG